MRNTVDVTGSKPIVEGSQSISGVSEFNPLVVLYDSEKGIGVILLVYPGHHTIIMVCIESYQLFKTSYYCSYYWRTGVIDRNI
jgi:hypothetical protein